MSTTKRVLCISLSVLFLWMTMQTAWAKEQETTYVLLEAQSGTIIDANNEETSLYGAGMTKLMSYLLFMEALHSGAVKSDEMVTVSDFAAGKGGTSAFLDPGEKHTFEALLKAAIVCSANDATCALAEHIAGGESAFCEQMNARALELGIDAVFFDCTGISENSLVSAADFAKIAAELSKYPDYFTYSSCWTYTFVHNSGRETEITNANTLIRDNICDGMITGSTKESGYHMVASAKSGKARFIVVVMGEKDAAVRAAFAKRKLMEAIGVYDVKQVARKGVKFRTIEIGEGTGVTADVYPAEDLILLYRKGEEQRITVEVEMDVHELPLEAGQIVGRILVNSTEGTNSVALAIEEDIDRNTYWKNCQSILRIWLNEKK